MCRVGLGKEVGCKVGRKASGQLKWPQLVSLLLVGQGQPASQPRKLRRFHKDSNTLQVAGQNFVIRQTAGTYGHDGRQTDCGCWHLHLICLVNFWLFLAVLIILVTVFLRFNYILNLQHAKYTYRLGVKFPVLSLSYVLYLLSSRVAGLKCVSKRLRVYEATKAKTAHSQ